MSNFRAFMKKPPLLLLLLAVCTSFLVPAWAEKADRNKPMNIEANTMRVDDAKQVTVFDGNVVMTKGSIVVRASKIDVLQSADGYQIAVITGAPGKPAFFRQKREAVDESIEVESQRIDYDGSADIVRFTGNAQLRRLRGTELADEISGALIVYENLTDKFSVDGSAASAAGEPASKGRVRAMLTPKPETTAPTNQAPKAPAQSSPTLRSTTTLGSNPQ